MLQKIMLDKPEITGSVVNEVILSNPGKLDSVTKDNQDLLTNIVKTVVAEANDNFSTIQKTEGCLAKHLYTETYRIEDV